MKLLFWRLKMNNETYQKEIKDSRKRLEETQGQWNEVQQAQHRLERWVEQAMRGGHA